MDRGAEWGLDMGWAGRDPEALDVVPIKTLDRELSRHCCLLRQTLNRSDLECPTSLILRPEHCSKILSNRKNR